MRSLVKLAVTILCLVTITSCAPDVYAKYQRMKQEAAWLEKTCIEGLAKDTEFVYKGSTAYIAVTCMKPTAIKPWIENIEILLVKADWRIQKRDAGATIFCLKNEGIRMTLVSASELENRLFLFRYPDRNCIQLEQ